MKRAQRDKRDRRVQQGQTTYTPLEQELQPLTQRPKVESLSPKTEGQRKYLNAIRHFQVTFGIGPAGTGKTFIAGAFACEQLESKAVEKVIITRPAVDAGESLGFLPGELEEKYEPYIAAFRDVLNERLGKTYVEYLLKIGRIEGVPFAYMRGRTFKNCVVILDEAQNATPEQMKLFLTRIGENCKVIINGDVSQKDIKGVCGLEDAANRVGFIPSVKTIRLTKNDVVRSGFVQEVIEAYEKGWNEKNDSPLDWRNTKRVAAAPAGVALL